MTLLIACLLIHLLALHWVWYVFAVLLWIVHLGANFGGQRQRREIVASNNRLADALRESRRE